MNTKKKFRKAKKSAERALDEGRNAADYALEASQETVVDAVESRYYEARSSVLGRLEDTADYLRRRPVATLCTAWSSGVILGLLLGMRAGQAVYR